MHPRGAFAAAIDVGFVNNLGFSGVELFGVEATEIHATLAALSFVTRSLACQIRKEMLVRSRAITTIISPPAAYTANLPLFFAVLLCGAVFSLYLGPHLLLLGA